MVLGWMEAKRGSIKSVKMKSADAKSVLSPVRPPCSAPIAASVDLLFVLLYLLFKDLDEKIIMD